MAKQVVTLSVNGEEMSALCEPRWLLSDVLRHQLGFTSVHVGCEQGACGACTVLLNGEPVRSCLMLAVQATDKDVTTVEGITPQTGLSPLQAAFQAHHALQCGYCTPGMLLTAHALLAEIAEPDADTIRERLSGNLCRCTGYQFIVDAVQSQVQSTRPGQEQAIGTDQENQVKEANHAS